MPPAPPADRESPDHAPPPEPGALRITPSRVLDWSPTEADRALDRLEERVPLKPRFVDLSAPSGSRAIVFGDSHGDWRSTADVIDAFLLDPSRSFLIGLGDYVDRAPEDCGAGSVANAMTLLGLAADHPDRVLLIVGNHELARRIPTLPHDLPEEVDELWGPEPERYERLLGLLERGPLAVRTDNGAYLAHAGFPRGDPEEWKARFDHPSDETLIDVTWSDCAGSGYYRGLGEPIQEPEVRRFLARTQSRLFLRGHDPPMTGRPAFHDTVLTLHTTRIYEKYGGVIYGTFPLDRPVEGAAGVELHHASAEGHEFPEP